MSKVDSWYLQILCPCCLCPCLCLAFSCPFLCLQCSCLCPTISLLSSVSVSHSCDRSAIRCLDPCPFPSILHRRPSIEFHSSKSCWPTCEAPAAARAQVMLITSLLKSCHYFSLAAFITRCDGSTLSPSLFKTIPTFIADDTTQFCTSRSGKSALVLFHLADCDVTPRQFKQDSRCSASQHRFPTRHQ